WRFIQGGMDPEGRGTDAKGIAYRTFYVISGLIYATLAVQAIRIALGAGGGGGGNETTKLAFGLMSKPWGVWVIGLAGVVIIGYALRQLTRAWTADISRQFMLSEVSAGWRIWVIRLSRFGMAARGVVFTIIGWFLLQAAWQHDPQEAQGLAGALRSIEQTAWGPWLAGLVAVGLAAYGVFTFLKGRYRRIETT
ncbi:MAG: DUF1206 domain-containing protein, partial [Thermoanaerobaculia bacterium]|nr:DUF1206 domain-containing protein [Thermoanaerobaculia bacterium]